MAHSDYILLGIPETADLDTIRIAYRKRAKETHPDGVSGLHPLKKHLLFIEVTKAYQRLVHGFVGTQYKKDFSGPNKGHSKGSLVRHKDPAYVYYKQGMKAFMQIHPSGWKLESGKMNRGNKGFLRVDASTWNTDSPRIHHTSPVNAEEQKRIMQRVQELTQLFPKAYYYFGLVVAEHPHSEWADDSKKKLEVIEERIQVYRRIVESFEQ